MTAQADVRHFPVLFENLGVPLATVIVSVLSLTGSLAATYVPPEVYGYVEQEDEPGNGAGGAPGAGGAVAVSKSRAEEGT